MKPKAGYEKCLNCGIKMKSVFFVAELTDNHKKILAQWTQQQLPEDGSICYACCTCLRHCETDDNPPRAVGHGMVCAWCGNSVFRKRFQAYSTEEYLPFMIPGGNLYKHYKTGQYILCRPCQHRLHRLKKKAEVLEISADTKTSDPQEKLFPNQRQLKHPQVYNTQVTETNADTKTSDPQEKLFSNQRQLKQPQVYNTQVKETITDTKTSEIREQVAPHLSLFKHQRLYFTKVARFEDDFLILPGFKKFPSKRRKCVIPKCQGKMQLISRAKRKLLFLQTNTLLDRRCSLCIYHQQIKNWPTFGIHNFTKLGVEVAISMIEKPVSTVDFDRINDMPDHLCKYWTGLIADEFKALYEKLNVDTSQYDSLRNALAVYLLRQKTGDSILKLANLFLMTTTTLSKQLMIIEKCFETYDSNKNDK